MIKIRKDFEGICYRYFKMLSQHLPRGIYWDALIIGTLGSID
jgi:hypothetical protein